MDMFLNRLSPSVVCCSRAVTDPRAAPNKTVPPTIRPTASQVGDKIEKSRFSDEKSLPPNRTNGTSPVITPAAAPLMCNHGRATNSTIATIAPALMPTKTMKPMVPERVISPTTCSASVRTPWAPSPEVAANTRITNRPRNPATTTPQMMPAEHTEPSDRSAATSLYHHRLSITLFERAVARIGSRPHRKIATAAKVTATSASPIMIKLSARNRYLL